MNKVAISALIGIAVGAAAIAAPYAGVQIPLPMLMAAAAAVSLGAAAAVLTLSILQRPDKHATGEKLLPLQLKNAETLFDKFPGRAGALDLTIRPDQKLEYLDVMKHPDKYKDNDITVRLKASSSSKFNPVDLKVLFEALGKQPGFIHLLLIDKKDEFVGYLPGFVAKRMFTGEDAVGNIARYLVGVFSDDSNSALLSTIDGAGKADIISDEVKVGDVLTKMAGGFKRLVVLKNGYHRRPVGVIDFGELLTGTLGGGVRQAQTGNTIGSFRPVR